MVPASQHFALSLASVPDWVWRTLVLTLLLVPVVRWLEYAARPAGEPFFHLGRLAKIAVLLGVVLLGVLWYVRGG